MITLESRRPTPSSSALKTSVSYNSTVSGQPKGTNSTFSALDATKAVGFGALAGGVISGLWPIRFTPGADPKQITKNLVHKPQIYRNLLELIR